MKADEMLQVYVKEFPKRVCLDEFMSNVLGAK